LPSQLRSAGGHYSDWQPRHAALLREHLAMQAEERDAANERQSEANRRTAEIADWKRKIDEEIRSNDEFEAEFDLRLKRAVDNVRRVHAEQAEALARKKGQATGSGE
jgi:hypothetical protein